MSSRSAPSAPRVSWWTKLARLPQLLWSMTGEAATALTDRSHQQPSRRKLALLRLGLLVLFVVLAPLALIFARVRFRRRGPSALAALDARVRELWVTSPHDAVALLRSTFDELRPALVAATMNRIEVAPFGRFEPWEALTVQRQLYECEVALGNYEAALAVAAALPTQVEETILQQVDCLLVMVRRADAVALLERNLRIDGWRGTLRRRLTELGGSPVRSVN